MSQPYPTVPFKAERARTDIFSAILRARREFGSKKIAIIDGDGRELSYNDVVRSAFALGSALGQHVKKGEHWEM